ncbi:MAG: hypothetical protein QXL51_01065 [Candidatus Aenigmatarchaeota archaeon]
MKIEILLKIIKEVMKKEKITYKELKSITKLSNFILRKYIQYLIYLKIIKINSINNKIYYNIDNTFYNLGYEL